MSVLEYVAVYRLTSCSVRLNRRNLLTLTVRCLTVQSRGRWRSLFLLLSRFSTHSTGDHDVITSFVRLTSFCQKTFIYFIIFLRVRGGPSRHPCSAPVSYQHHHRRCCRKRSAGRIEAQVAWRDH